MSTARTLWNVPYQRNPYFTGREDVLSKLHNSLHAENAVALAHPHGISGLGGIGKTQMALEYAYRYRTEYQAVLWVRADSAAALTSSFVDLAHVLNLPERNEQDQNIIIEAVQHWFRRQTEWLLVFDNMDAISIAAPFIPIAGPGHIVFTTRAHSLEGIASRLDVPRMEPDTGALLLLRRASLIPLQATLDLATSDESHLANQISHELDGLPLALDQAGAYIKETPYTLAGYLQLYQQRRRDLLQTRGPGNKDYPASVATTWSLSFEKVSQAHPAATELLNLCAFLAPDAIPEEIFTTGAPHLGKILARVAAHPLQLDRACQEALRFSLIARAADDQSFTMHRLVQAILQDMLPSKIGSIWKRRTVSAVNATFPSVQFENWTRCERLSPHALVCANWIEKEHITNPEATNLLNTAGLYLDHRSRYSEAEPLYKQALSIREQQLGTTHIEVAQSLHNLALLYKSLGKYAEAEPLLKRAISIFERRFGPERPPTALSLSNLAVLYMEQERYAEAEPLLKRALAIYEKNMGLAHPKTASSLSKLAGFYMKQGKYAEAEPLLKRVLAIDEQESGATASSLNNLASLYEAQGRYREAEELYQRALVVDEQIYGSDHPEVAIELNNLAYLYYTQGKFAQAEPLHRRALSIREQYLGTDHPSTAQSLNHLALLYHSQGKYVEAELFYQRALAIREQKLGATHSYTLGSLNNLANLYADQGKYAEAKPLFRRALSLYEQQMGAMHPRTQTVRENYIHLLQNLTKQSISAGQANNLVPGYTKAYHDLLELLTWGKIPSQPAGTAQTDKSRFDSFTKTARNVLISAQEEAIGLQHSYIGTEHLLLGIVSESEGIAAKTLNDLGIELHKVRREVELIIGRGDLLVASEIGLTPRAKKMIELAVDEARHLHHHAISPEHLLFGLICEGEGIGVNVLESLDVNLEKLQTLIFDILSQPTLPVPQLLKDAHTLLEQVLSQKGRAILEQQDDLVAELYAQELQLRERISTVETEWSKA